MTLPTAHREARTSIARGAVTREVGPPGVFLFPGLGGDDRELRALRDGCAGALRCIPVAFPDWTEIHARGIGFDAFVEFCAASILERAPAGPVRLAGYSFGGTMAFAIALRLAGSGIPVAKLGLLDAPARPAVVNHHLSTAGRWRRLTRAVQEHDIGGELGRLIAGLLIRAGSPRLLDAAARIRHVRLPFEMHEHIQEPLQTRFRLPLLKTLTDRLAEAGDPCDIPTVLFRCDGHPPGTAPDLGWAPHIAPLGIVRIAGDHSVFKHPERSPNLCARFAAEMAAP